MTDTGTEFLNFLKANHPEDYSKLSSDSVSDSLVNAVFSKHRERFETWMKVPEWIRNKYNGRVPEDILAAARTDPNLTEAEVKNIENNRPEEKLADMMQNVGFTAADYTAAAIIAKAITDKGYSTKAAQNLAYTRQIRHKLAADNPSKLTPEQKKMWCETREYDHKTIKKDWCENQPERMAVHLLKQLNRGKFDKEAALPQLDSLLNKIIQQKREKEFVECLRSPQGQLKHYTPETKEFLGELIKSHQIPMTPLQKAMQNESFEFLGDKARPVQNRERTIPGPTKQMPPYVKNNNFQR